LEPAEVLSPNAANPQELVFLGGANPTVNPLRLVVSRVDLIPPPNVAPDLYSQERIVAYVAASKRNPGDPVPPAGVYVGFVFRGNGHLVANVTVNVVP
jgi:hypothetical protein